MGSIFYGDMDHAIHIDDAVLAHLKVVIITKLRRQESFSLSWQHPEGETPGRSTIWLHQAIPLRFVFDSPESAPLNPEWVTAMANSVNSTGGITVLSKDMLSAEEAAAASEAASQDG